MKLRANVESLNGACSRFEQLCGSKQIWLALIISAACLLLAVSALPQGIATGSISGTVADPSGAMVPGAKVTATNAATNTASSAQTNNEGAFALRSLPPGTYKVTIESPNFRTVILDKIEVFVSRDTDLGTPKLELGKLGETVQVEGAAPLIESSTAQVTTSFSSEAVAALPLNRGFDILTLFIPGVADAGTNNFRNTNVVGLSAHSLRGRPHTLQIPGHSYHPTSLARAS